MTSELGANFGYNSGGRFTGYSGAGNVFSKDTPDDIPQGAMISLVLMALTLVVLLALRRYWTKAEVAA